MDSWIPKYPLWFFWFKEGIFWKLVECEGMSEARKRWDEMNSQDFVLSGRP